MARKKIKVDEDTRHELFLMVLEELAEWDIQALAEMAGVSNPTLYNWQCGYTMNPSTRTLFAVAEAMGFVLEWKRSRATAKAVIVRKRHLRVVK